MNESLARADNERRLFAQRHDQFGHLPGPILRDLARNEGAAREWRKAAIELMLEKGYPEVNHPELGALLREVRDQRAAKEEVQSIVEAAIEAPLDEVPVSVEAALKKTRVIYDDPLAIDNLLAPAPEAPLSALKASFTTANLNQDETVA
jgi:hypothetical protein